MVLKKIPRRGGNRHISSVSPLQRKEEAMPLQLLYEIIEAFPQADPASEFYNEEIDGCEAVNFLSGFIPEVRKCLNTLRQPENEPLETLKACWDFIENVTDDDPERTDRFFKLRERVRNCFGQAEANLPAVTKQKNTGNQSGKGGKDGR